MDADHKDLLQTALALVPFCVGEREFVFPLKKTDAKVRIEAGVIYAAPISMDSLFPDSEVEIEASVLVSEVMVHSFTRGPLAEFDAGFPYLQAMNTASYGRIKMEAILRGSY